LRIFSFPTRTVTADDRHHELPMWWWLLLPMVFFVLRYTISIFTHKRTGLESWLDGELGLIENLTVLLLVMSTLVTVYLIYRYGKVLHLIPNLFLIVYCIGCIYFAGEEASWGQHWFGWETGEYYLKNNDQQETNLHNTSVWLDRVPKAIVSLCIFIGGLFIPLYFRRKSLTIDCRKPMWWLFPTLICVPTALIVTIATLPSKLERLTGWTFYFNGAQEMKELYIAYFFLLFVVSLGLRLRHYQATDIKFSPL
jgi:lysylphosphatidylglycerol synthetase-like protein (DUF2156 family)